MAYLPVDDPELIEDLYTRKEFYSLRGDPQDDFRSVDPSDHTFKLHSYQLFVQRLINPNTPYRRALLMYPPGIGKTLSAIAILQSHNEMYKMMYGNATSRLAGDKRKVAADADKATPSYFVFGFDPTKKAFYRDLMRYPELGFVTQDERDTLAQLARIAASTGLPGDRKRYKDEEAFLKRRITQKSKDGFYKFIGYQKLVNLLFAGDNNLVALEREAIRTGTTLEDLVARDVASGKIKINQEFLKLFRNSVIVCDEAQHLYNSYHKNNYGVALQYILDVYGDNITLVLLSATIINNSPSEVVEVINFLNPAKVKKSDLFVNRRDLRPGALERIASLFKGRVSFVQDSNPAYFPKRLFVGEPHRLARTTQGIDEIPYVPLINCEMSAFHRATYEDLMRQVARDSVKEPGKALADSDALADASVSANTEPPAMHDAAPGDALPSLATVTGEPHLAVEGVAPETEEESAPPERGRPRVKAVSMSNRRKPIKSAEDEDADDFDSQLTHIPTNGYSIYDIAFPNPDSDTIGLFRSVETRGRLQSAPQEWLDRNGIEVKRKGSEFILTGNFLLRKNIERYSTKLAKLLDILDEIYIESDPSKSQYVTALTAKLPKSGVGDKQKTENSELLAKIEKMVYMSGQKIAIYHDRVKMSGVRLICELLRVNGYLDEYSEPIDTTRCAFCLHRMAGHMEANRDTPHRFIPARFVAMHSEVDRSVMDASMIRFNSIDNIHGMQAKILVGSKIIREGYDFICTRHNIVMGLPVNIPALLQEMGRFNRKYSHAYLPQTQRTITNRCLVSTINGEVTAEELRWVEKMNDYKSIQLIEREIHAQAVDAGIHRDLIMPASTLGEYFPGRAFDTKTAVYKVDAEPRAVLGNLYYDVKTPKTYDIRELRTVTFLAYKYYDQEIAIIQSVITRLFNDQPVWTYAHLWQAVQHPSVNLEMNPRLFSEGNFAIALTRMMQKPTMEYAIEQMAMYYIKFPVLNGKVIRDVDSYMRTPSMGGMTTVDVDKWVMSSKSNHNYLMRKMQFKKRYCGETDVFNMLNDFDSEFYERLLMDIIQHKIDGRPAVDERLSQLYDKVIQLFDRFKMIIYVEDAVRFRDVARKFGNLHVIRPASGETNQVAESPVRRPVQFTSHVDPKLPVGFVSLNGVRLYDSPDWIETSKVSMNIRTQFVEDAPVVGYLDDSQGRLRFKIRKPLHLIKREGVDIRTVEKGAVCGTKSKEELVQWAAILGIKDRGPLVKDLCEEIKRKLLENEMRHRQKDTKGKAFYLWNEVRPL